MHAAFGLIMGYILAKGIKKNGKMSIMTAVLVATIIHGAYGLVLNPSLVDKWGGLALALAILCMGLNLYNFFWMSKARKNPYYSFTVSSSSAPSRTHKDTLFSPTVKSPYPSSSMTTGSGLFLSAS